MVIDDDTESQYELNPWNGFVLRNCNKYAAKAVLFAAMHDSADADCIRIYVAETN